MKKRIQITVTLVLIACFLCSLAVVMEFAQQKRNIIRLHVVGASNSETDQAVKLLVRDAVLSCVSDDLALCKTAEEAKQCLIKNLQSIENAAADTLRNNGMESDVRISLGKEAFPVRDYETFSLPSGVYQSLRIEIGEAEGRNWWCVVFPSFCYGVSTDDFRSVAAGSGFSEPLTDTLAGDREYKLNFLLLDFLGRLENFFHFG